MTIGTIVGPVVGEPADATDDGGGGGQSPPPSFPRVPGSDFIIGGLSFKIDAEDGTPYQRQTAPFKKDQLDTSANYGDQSLTGYWTRGEFSFHRGDGIKYYEVSDPNGSVDYRFFESSAVDVSTPGITSCYPLWNDILWSGSNLKAYAETADGWGAIHGTDLAISGSGFSETWTPKCLTASDEYLYVGADNKGLYAVNPTTGEASVATSSMDDVPVMVAWAKDRLWAVDASGNCIVSAGDPDNPSSSPSPIFTKFGVVDDEWSFCDTPGSVFFGNSNEIYAVSIDSASGDIPTLGSPVAAAVLPPGEKIVSMAFNLGVMLVCTSAGLRAAEVSGSQIVFGPLCEEGTGGLTAVPWRNGAVGICDGDAYYVDFSQSAEVSKNYGTPIGLRYAAHKVAEGSFLGCAASPGTGSTPRFFTSGAVVAPGPSFGPGWLETGLHRYATMEPKKFQTVRIRGEGDGGTITVSKFYPDGSSSGPLYTLDLAVNNDITIGLQEPLPIESLGLRFDMKPQSDDATVSPSLLGYQLKALPCPRRQRLVSVPLLCFDHEVRPAVPKTGHAGSAWERLRALEEMEQSGGTFRFTDYRTGESGECEIEQVQFENKTPPSAKSTGFGGRVTLIIKKL